MTRRQTIALLAVVGICIALYLTLYKFGVIGVLSCSAVSYTHLTLPTNREV